jgi:hypothetical protein
MDDGDGAGGSLMSLPRFYFLLVWLILAVQPSMQAQVLTSQYDNLRTGANLRETVLKPSNVDAKTFGKLFSRTVDGDVFAQPLPHETAQE